MWLNYEEDDIFIKPNSGTYGHEAFIYSLNGEKEMIFVLND